MESQKNAETDTLKETFPENLLAGSLISKIIQSYCGSEALLNTWFPENKIAQTVQDFCKECVVDYHRVNKSISPNGSVQQLTMKVFENMLKIDPKTGKRKPITVKDESIFKKSFKDRKVAGITTVYRDKEINKNGGWKGRILDFEGNRWLAKHEKKVRVRVSNFLTK